MAQAMHGRREDEDECEDEVEWKKEEEEKVCSVDVGMDAVVGVDILSNFIFVFVLFVGY